MFSGDYGFQATSFEQSYRCYPGSFIDKSHIESGDKVILPPSALDRLASLHIDYPMLFELHNLATERRSHCGVLEFTAEEGLLYMPYWMMQNMLLQEGEIVRVKNATLPKGTYVKLQPHTQDFLDISNPKAVLETTLRNFSCLTTGDSIMVSYNSKNYYIDIIETKPSSSISIIETDCEVDFATPLDYKEPKRGVTVPCAALSRSQENKEATEPKFIPFTGVGRRMDGKPVQYSGAPLTSRVSSSTYEMTNTKPLGPSSSSSAAKHSPGKVIFGSDTNNDPVKAAVKEVVKEEVQKETPKFKAFTGRRYLLKG